MKYKKYGPLWQRALRAVHFGAIGGLVYVTAAGFIISYVLSPVWVRQAEANSYNVFSPTSFWTKPLPKYPVLNGSSASIVSQLSQQVTARGSSFDTTDAAAAVYEVGAGAATVAVTPWDCTGAGSVDVGLAAQWLSVPMPFYAVAGGAAVVYQPDTQTMWEFGNLRKQGGNWEACSGGKINPTLANSGILGAPYGITATSLARLSGQVGIAELQTGRIQHAIGLSLPMLNANETAWPVVNYRGANTPGALYPGLRLQLDPAINVDSLGLEPIAALVAKAAQTYGFVVWDTAAVVEVLGENPVSYTARGANSPYAALGASGSSILANFPWGSLRALPAGYGQSTEAPLINSFSAVPANIAVGERLQLTWEAIDVDSCAIPGVTGSVPASGTVTTPPLMDATIFTLSCSGPGGSVSRQLNVAVIGQNANDVPRAVTALTITSPMGSNSVVLPEFNSAFAAETIQKVIYSERTNALQATTTPPFALDTTKMPDGQHNLAVEVRYRDGHTEQRTITVKVMNQTQPLRLQASQAVAEVQSIPRPWAGLGIAGSMMTMGLTGWFGWRRL